MRGRIAVCIIAVGICVGAAVAEEVALNHPQGLCYDAQDNLYVADTGNHRIIVFSPGLATLRILGGEQGSSEGQFNEPSDVAVDSTGRIIVADTRNHRLQVFGGDGTFLVTFGKQGQGDGEFNGPTNVTIDDRDNIIVTDRWNHRLQVLDRNGKHLFTLANQTGQKSEERIAQERQWAIDDGKKPEEININPTWANTDVGQLNEPGGTFYDPTLKRLYLANGWNCRIEVFDYDSTTGEIRQRGPVKGIVWGFWLTRSVTGDRRGNLYGCDTNFGNIGVFADRASLNSRSQKARNEGGGAYGDIKMAMDIATNSQGDIAVADMNNSRIVIFDKDFSKPESPSVPEITADSATIAWSTKEKCETEALYRKSMYPSLTPGHEDPWASGDEEIEEARARRGTTTNHTLTIRGLEPGTRYYYKLRAPGARTIPGSGWSREYAVNTLGGPGMVSYVAIPVKTLITTNVIFTESLRPDTTFPEPMPPDEIQMYKDNLAETMKFYWINSSMHYLVDEDIYVDETMCRKGRFAATREKAGESGDVWTIDAGRNFGFEAGMKGVLAYIKDGEPVTVAQAEIASVDQESAQVKVADATEEVRPGLSFVFDTGYMKLPEQNQGRSFEEGIKAAGNEGKIYYGQVIFECERRWNAGEKKWYYQGSGGGTYGVEWPTPGRSSFLGGSDIAWLMCHEFKHQIESQYNNSGLDKEDDRMWFCHFSPKYDNPDPKIGKWQWDTAADHGEHWDGIAWQFRHMTQTQWMRNMYGEVRTAKDTDGDGIPDDAPQLPLDEKRFNSDPTAKDTDGDGLDDMQEALASTWVTALNTDIRQRTGNEYIRPNPRSKDSDGDGVIDGQDKYPIYPFDPVIPRGTATIDGNLSEWPIGDPWIWMDSHGVVCQGWARHDDDYLYLAFGLRGPWSRISVVTDNNADGFYVGNDNLYIRIRRDGQNPPVLESARAHLCNMNRWPYFDDKQEYFQQDTLQYKAGARGDSQFFEIAIPKHKLMGLDLKKGEEVGLMVYIGLEKGGSLAIFEPWDIFDSTLE
jgi:DNA-binding beta-propeller fold protein YncE